MKIYEIIEWPPEQIRAEMDKARHSRKVRFEFRYRKDTVNDLFLY